MSEQDDTPEELDSSRGGARARRVASSQKAKASRAERAAAASVAGKRRAPRRKHTVAKVITATLMTLAMATAVSVVMLYNHWNSNLDYQDLTSQLGDDRPEKKEVEGEQEPLNVLVMGSDTRQGEGNNVDGMKLAGERSDTTIMFHLSANRERAYAISIPRDTLVDRPDCIAEDGSKIPGAEDVMWNEAFSVGGPACTIRQFEQISGIRIDNYVVVDFNGFKDMVDAVDGVEVCIPEQIYDPEHQITLEEGTREVKGDEALAYVRVRYTVGDGTDPNRIKRQQAFMASMINKVVSGGTIARPDRLIGFLNAATASLTTDFKNVGELADLGGTAQGIGLDKIKFVTTPWVYSTTQEGRVEWTPEVEKLWQLVIDDLALTPQFLEQSISAADDPEGGSDTTDSTDGTAGTDPTETDPTDGDTGGGKKNDDKPDEGLSEEAREAAGLCN